MSIILGDNNDGYNGYIGGLLDGVNIRTRGSVTRKLMDYDMVNPWSDVIAGAALGVAENHYIENWCLDELLRNVLADVLQ